MKSLLMAGATALALSTAAHADIIVHDAYARSAMPSAPTGAAFMVIENTADSDDRLVAVRSGAAARVELHTHLAGADGVVKMTRVDEGFAVPARSEHRLQRGGDHVMFMGLTEPFEQGATVAVTLTFEKAGDIDLDIPVDLARVPDHATGGGSGHDHGTMGAGN